jgi:hypothetical protein
MNMFRARPHHLSPFVVGLCALVSAGLAAGPVHAQEGKIASPAGKESVGREKERTALYNEGLALAEAQRWQEAWVKFQGVVAIRSAPRALVAVATAEEKMGRLTGAKRTYQKALADARSTGENDMVEKTSSALAALEALIPRVVLRFGSGGTSAAVILDGVIVSVGPDGIEVDPGEHRIVVTAGGDQPFEQSFQISAGQRKEILVDVVPVGGARAGDKDETSLLRAPDRSGAPLLQPPLPVWILGGAGVIATTVGLVVFVKGKSDYDDASKGCSNGICKSMDAYTKGNAGRDRMIAGGIVAGVGVAAVAGAGIWWIVRATGSPKASDSRAFSVRANASPDGCSVRLQGAF